MIFLADRLNISRPCRLGRARRGRDEIGPALLRSGGDVKPHRADSTHVGAERRFGNSSPENPRVARRSCLVYITPQADGLPPVLRLMTSVADRAIVEKGPAAWDKGALVFFALLLLLCLAIFRDYGISFDERLNDSQGRSIIAYYATGFADRRAQAETIDNQYGFIFDIAANLLGPSLPFEHYQARHLLNALVGILGVVGCWRLARYLFDARAALLGAVSLALVPSYFGHAFMNPKDIPFAAGYVWSIYFLLRCLAALPRVPWPSSLSFGATWGLALAVKVPAAMIGIYLMLGAGAMLWLRHRRDPGLRMPALLAAAAGRLLPSLAIAYAVMIASWPWAQLDPLGNPLRALRTFAHFPQWGSEVTLAGAR